MMAVGQTALAMLAMALVGRLALGGRLGIGIQTLAGWGVLCLLLILWGVLLPFSLRIPAAAFLALALAAIPLTRHMPWREDAAEVLRLLLLALPLLAVMAPMEPSQLDVFALILPNSAYLFDHGVFPTALGPPAHSDSPVAPYGKELPAFLGSLAGGGFAPAGVAQFTVWLHLPAGLLLGRALAGGERPGWGMAAFGLLLATALNPGFVPRVSFAGYGEAPLAIALMAVLFLGSRLLTDEAQAPATRTAFALILAALAMTKQQAVGLLLALGIAGLGGIALLPAANRSRKLRHLALAALPALILYVAWRAHVVLQYPEGEQQTHWQDAWENARLSLILRDMAGVAAGKLFLFAPLLLVLGLAIRPPRFVAPCTAMMLRLCALACVFFNLFLLVTFLLHFGREHSYFRYNTQLAQAMVLALILVGGDWARGRPRPSPAIGKAMAAIAILLMLGTPVAAQILLRFDNDQPQPQLRFLAGNLAQAIAPDARIALILPGDNSTSGMALESLLRHTSPRRPHVAVTHVPNPHAGTLGQVAVQGFDLALVSCAERARSLGLDEAPPPRSAQLFRLEAGKWRHLATWTYPDPGKRGKWGWSNFIAEEPFCMGSG